MTPVVIDDISKTYPPGVRALRGVSMRIERHETVALWGPSGCGKSTLLALIGCLDRPTSGSVVIDGTPTSALDDHRLTRIRRDRIGSVFQSFQLIPTLSVAENIAVPLVLAHIDRASIERRVLDVIERVGLSEKYDALPQTLSGGQAQRAAIARAIVHQPAIVLADEPTGNLDQATGAAILTLLLSLAQDGQAIAIATHDRSVADACTRRITLRDGALA